MFKERKNKAPYLEYYCRGMTDRQISNITGRSVAAIIIWRRKYSLPPNPNGAIRSQREARRFLRRLQIDKAPEKERRIFRQFASDLLRCVQHCSKPDIMKFINTWRNEKGVKQVWDSPAPQKGREKKKQSA